MAETVLMNKKSAALFIFLPIVVIAFFQWWGQKAPKTESQDLTLTVESVEQAEAHFFKKVSIRNS